MMADVLSSSPGEPAFFQPVRRASLGAHVDAGALLQTAPVLWRADAGADATALHVDTDYVVLATNDGRVSTLEMSGKVFRVQVLPSPASALMKTGLLSYAWCPAPQFGFGTLKGALFDITNEEPRLLFEVQDIGDWMQYATMQGELLVLGDDKGSLYELDLEGNVVWRAESQGSSDSAGKVLLSDESGIYWGQRKKLVKYALQDGEEMWEYAVTGRFASLHSATQDKDHIYLEVDGSIVQLSKMDGSVQKTFVASRHRASNVCVGNNVLITGSCPTVIFDLETAQEKYRMNFSGRLVDAFLQLHDNGRLFAAWDGLYCIDVTTEGLDRAAEGRSTRTLDLRVLQGKNTQPVLLSSSPPSSSSLVSDAVLTTTDTDAGVILVCEVEGDDNDQIKVHPVGGQYNADWSVRFPKNLQKPGAKFVVESLTPHEKYSFYSIVGQIKQLIE